jgi:hypothetical protein
LMLKRVLFLIAAMLLLDARAWAEPDALAQRVKRVGVLVLVDDQLELARVGILVFGNKRAMIETPLGMLADIAYEVIETELGKEERYQVRRVEMADSDRRRLAAIGYEQSKGFFGPSLGPLAGQIAPHLQRCECDALLVVTTGDGITDPNSNQRFRGFAWVGLGSDAVSRTQVTSTQRHPRGHHSRRTHDERLALAAHDGCHSSRSLARATAQLRVSVVCVFAQPAVRARTSTVVHADHPQHPLPGSTTPSLHA